VVVDMAPDRIDQLSNALEPAVPNSVVCQVPSASSIALDRSQVFLRAIQSLNLALLIA